MNRKTTSLLTAFAGALFPLLAFGLPVAKDPPSNVQPEYFKQLGVTPSEVGRFYSSICTNRILEAAFISSLLQIHLAHVSACSRLWDMKEKNPVAYANISESDEHAIINGMICSNVVAEAESNWRIYARGGEVFGSHIINLKPFLAFKGQGHDFMTADEFDKLVDPDTSCAHCSPTNEILNAKLKFEDELLFKFRKLSPTCTLPVAIPIATTIRERHSMCRAYCTEMDEDEARIAVWLFFQELNHVNPSWKLSREAWRAFRNVMANREGGP